MANIVLNDALGRVAEKVADGANIIIVPLSAVAADATLKDQTNDLATVLAGGSTEQTTGNWNRKTVANGSLTLTVDDSTDTVRVFIPDQTWTPGPTAGNNVVALLVCEDGASDAARFVLTKHDFAVTADGNEVTADFSATNGFWSST